MTNKVLNLDVNPHYREARRNVLVTTCIAIVICAAKQGETIKIPGLGSDTEVSSGLAYIMLMCAIGYMTYRLYIEYRVVVVKNCKISVGLNDRQIDLAIEKYVADIGRSAESIIETQRLLYESIGVIEDSGKKLVSALEVLPRHGEALLKNINTEDLYAKLLSPVRGGEEYEYARLEAREIARGLRSDLTFRSGEITGYINESISDARLFWSDIKHRLDALEVAFSEQEKLHRTTAKELNQFSDDLDKAQRLGFAVLDMCTTAALIGLSWFLCSGRLAMLLLT